MGWTRERAKVAALKRHRAPDDPDVLDAERDLTVARAEDYIRAVVASAPPLRPDDVERLRALLPAAPVTNREAA